ncbi:CCA tRNA nucleotidyltransferase [Sneathiella chinensis]|uniref:Poly(A) polymerase n=1 Tax=Sneathiella chinensis TaxID=349750 RepID=A0ABQ5U0K0_9PROT|nr:CCA tRNA nucleotidyltransferase [Sneathiella chinensis]GLQ05732.1 poly(A) polymerase [Sneathiella chinensis]
MTGHVLLDLAEQPPDWLSCPETCELLRLIHEAGGEGMFVGGCVRDALIGRTTDDLDLCTDLRPEKVMEALQEAGHRVIPTGLKHGTVTVLIGHFRYEVTTLRVDVQTFGRHAEVAFTRDWAEDAQRRDFTMNALYLAGNGDLFDPVGGLDDLAAGRVRFIGDAHQRIAEDRLRILRYFRFLGRYGVAAPDQEALAACRQAAADLAHLSAERVSKELLQILALDRPATVLEEMQACGVLEVIFKRPVRLHGVLALLALPLQTDAVLRLGAVLKSSGADPLEFSRRLRLSRHMETRLCAMLDGGLGATLDEGEQKASLYRLGRTVFTDQSLLAWSETGSDRYAAYVTLAETWHVPIFPVTGKDLLDLGLPPGPKVGNILAALEECWIASTFSMDRKALLERVSSHLI